MQTPEERYSSHKSHKERRITDWCQTSTHIRYHKDKEYHDMAFSLPPGIHLDYRSYHQHTGTGRSDTAGQKSSESEQAGIYPRRACKITFHGNITRNTEKSEKKNNKSKIIIYNTFKNCLCCFACTINHRKRNHHQQNPHKYHMWLMCFPPFSFDQRHHGDAEQQPRKRNAQPYRHLSGCFSTSCCPDTCRTHQKHGQKHSKKCYCFFQRCHPHV